MYSYVASKIYYGKMTEFIDLPENTVFEILALLPGIELLEVCSTNTQIADICNSGGLWQLKISEDFPQFDINSKTDMGGLINYGIRRGFGVRWTVPSPEEATVYDRRQLYIDLLNGRVKAEEELAVPLTSLFPDPSNISPQQLTGRIAFQLVKRGFPLLYKRSSTDWYQAEPHIILIAPRTVPRYQRGSYRYRVSDTKVVDERVDSIDEAASIIRELLPRDYVIITKVLFNPYTFEFFHSLGVVDLGTDPQAI